MKQDRSLRVGILITHGTDTLAWTHAFLRYSIKNNHANIVLTGSQIPMSGAGAFSDAYENIENSMRFLTTLAPPHIIAVFNYGQDAFSDSLWKIQKWDNIAFVGDKVAQMRWDEIKYHDDSIAIVEPDPLDKFYLITTGGTIEAEYNEAGVLVPGNNYVLSYLAKRFSAFFKDLSQDPVFAIDSSDLTFERVVQISTRVGECLKETNPRISVDHNFNKNVKVIYTDPFKTSDHYEKECEGAEGIIFAGYGGGNLPINDRSNQSIISLIEKKIGSNIPVVLASQVPIGVTDFIYENGYKVIQAGAFSGVDLSLAECQIRLSYLLGHRDEIQSCANDMGKGFMEVIEWLFMSGMKFRTKRSKKIYEEIKHFEIFKDDLPINHTFDEILEKYQELQAG